MFLLFFFYYFLKYFGIAGRVPHVQCSSAVLAEHNIVNECNPEKTFL